MKKATLLFLMIFCTFHWQVSAQPSDQDIPVLFSDHGGMYGEVYAVAWSPDGETLAIATSEGIWLYNTNAVDVPAHHLTDAPLSNDIRNMTFSPDGHSLALAYAPSNSADESGAIISIVDVRTGIERQLGEPGYPRFAARVVMSFTPDGLSLLSGAGELATLQRWNVETGSVKNLFPESDTLSRYNLFDLNADASRVLVSYSYYENDMLQDWGLQVFDLATKSAIGNYSLMQLPENQYGSTAADFHENLVAFSYNNSENIEEVYFWDVEDDKVIPSGVEFPNIASLMFNTDGSRLAIIFDDVLELGKIAVWDVPQNTQLGLLTDEHLSYQPDWLAFQPNGESLAFLQGSIAQWNFTSAPTTIYRSPRLSNVAINHDGSMIAYYLNSDLLLWDGITTKVMADDYPNLEQIRFSPDSGFLVALQHLYLRCRHR